MKLKEWMLLNIVKIYPVERQSTMLMPRILVRVIRIHAYRIRTIETSPLAINRRSTKGVGVYYKMVTGLQTNANRSCNKNTPKARGVQIKHVFEAVIKYTMFSNILHSALRLLMFSLH